MRLLGRMKAPLLVLGIALLLACDTRTAPYRIPTPVPGDPDGFSNALYQATGVRLAPGHRVELVNNGALFDRLADELAAARHSINIVLFIWRPTGPSQRLVEVITARAKAGVSCRVLVDALASRDFEDQVQPALTAAGCEVRWFRPLEKGPTAQRNHRKIVVIDGRVGLTGGFGIEEVWLGEGRAPGQWRESNVVVRGPAVSEMQQAFADNWQEAGGALLPATDFPRLPAGGPTRAGFVSSTASEHLTKADRLIQLIIASAQRRVWIANAYFVPSPGLTTLLLEQRARGIDVRVMAAGPQTDHPEVLREQRATYPKLLAGDVRVFEYQPSLLHSKTMLVDDHLGVVGSINLDRLSLDEMEEGALVLSDPKVAAQLAKDFEDDLAFCSEQLRPAPSD